MIHPAIFVPECWSYTRSLESEQTVILRQECYWGLSCCLEGRMKDSKRQSSVKTENDSYTCSALLQKHKTDYWNFMYLDSILVCLLAFVSWFYSSHASVFLRTLMKNPFNRVTSEVWGLSGPWKLWMNSHCQCCIFVHPLQQIFAWYKAWILTHLADHFTW